MHYLYSYMASVLLFLTLLGCGNSSSEKKEDNRTIFSEKSLREAEVQEINENHILLLSLENPSKITENDFEGQGEDCYFFRPIETIKDLKIEVDDTTAIASIVIRDDDTNESFIAQKENDIVLTLQADNRYEFCFTHDGSKREIQPLFIYIKSAIEQKNSRANKADVKQLNATNSCIGCDLSAYQFNKENVYLMGVNLSEANLTKASFQGCDLDNAILDNANVKDVSFIASSLIGTSMQNITSFDSTQFLPLSIDQANFTNSDLRGFNIKDILYKQDSYNYINFSNTNLSDVSFVGANLSHSNFENANLTEADFSNAVLQFSNFSHANLSDTEFNNATLSHAKLEYIDTLKQDKFYVKDIDYSSFAHTNLSKFSFYTNDYNRSSITGVNFTYTNLTQANLKDRTFIQCNFTNATLTQTRMTNSHFVDTTFYGAYFDKTIIDTTYFSGANLEAITLKNTPLRNVTLNGANLSNTKIEGQDFSNYDLTGTNFTNASLKNCKFTNATLKNAIFKNADLSNLTLENVNFSYCNLKGANLSYANLNKSNFSEANLDGATLYKTSIDETNFSEATLNRAIFTEGELCAEASKGSCIHQLYRNDNYAGYCYDIEDTLSFDTSVKKLCTYSNMTMKTCNRDSCSYLCPNREKLSLNDNYSLCQSTNPRFSFKVYKENLMNATTPKGHAECINLTQNKLFNNTKSWVCYDYVEPPVMDDSSLTVK